ncbi:uncharacterized protein LOC117124703 isoform X2 [Anneissia japonica]|uniref:uncharacterized protein LOC117124703 isoform X2 n=1 Tax=Anneissia japonica TaxID=1529436 RepID=UPI0014259BFD|nr:uncharacterized protein LOC117124703 isoform X2 [Anneissia japonica]
MYHVPLCVAGTCRTRSMMILLLLGLGLVVAVLQLPLQKLVQILKMKSMIIVLNPALITPYTVIMEAADNLNLEAGADSSSDIDSLNEANSDSLGDDGISFDELSSDADASDSTEEDDPEDSSDDQDELGTFVVDDSLNEKLCVGVDTTRAEVLLMVMTFVMRHCLSSVALVDLLKLINEIFGKAVLLSSKFLFDKVFQSKSLNFKFHFYCTHCFSFVSTYDDGMDNRLHNERMPCPECRRDCTVKKLSDNNFFITSGLKSQVKTLFETPGISQHLSYKTNRNKQEIDNMEDIYDGEIYQRLCEPGQPLHNVNNFSYSFNSDGVPIFKSSKYSLWPIYIMINELPPKLRMNNLLLAGVWLGKSEPQMNTFLHIFLKEALLLETDGIFWNKEGEQVHSKLYGICCSVDAPARAAMSNTMQYNAYMGCGICYHPGKAVERVIKYPVDVGHYEDREDHEVLQDMIEAVGEGHIVRGVKGPSPLINMPHFSIVWGFPPDFMHCVLLGVSKQLACLWFESQADSPYYIGSPNIVSRLDRLLKQIKTPMFVARKPRPISERKYWKASEWCNWLLFFLLPCLLGILPNVYLTHVCLLVKGVHVLLRKSVSKEEVNVADNLLFQFVSRMQLLYESSAMTFNVHSLTHLATSVKMWGPLWSHSCFPFESANGKIKTLLKGNRGIMQQAMYKFLLIRTLPTFPKVYMVSNRIKVFCDNTYYPRKCHPSEIIGQVQLYGSGNITHLSDMEQEALRANGYLVGNEVLVYKRLNKGGLFYHTVEYKRAVKVNSRVFYLSDGTVGELQKIIYYEREQCIILFKALTLLSVNEFKDRQSGANVSHIKLCSYTGQDINVVSAFELAGSCLSFNVGRKAYVCFPPNHVALC